MTRPLLLKTAKHRYWLVLEGGCYKRIAVSLVRLRLRELGHGSLLSGAKGERRPAELFERFGAVVTRADFEAAEQGGAK